MIVRISRSRYAVSREGELSRTIEPLVDGRPRPRGLLDLIAARRALEDGLVERLVVSMWTDEDDLKRGMDPPWDAAGAIDDAGAVSESVIEQFDIDADDWPEFVELIKSRSGRLS